MTGQPLEVIKCEGCGQPLHDPVSRAQRVGPVCGGRRRSSTRARRAQIDQPQLDLDGEVTHG